MPFRRVWLWAMVIAAAQLLCAPTTRAANPQPPAELIEGIASLSLTPHLSYLHDKNAIDTADDAWRRIAIDGFQPVPAGKTAFGFQQGAYWFHATVVNRDPDERHWMLVQRFALIDRIDLFLRYPDGRIVQQASGDLLPFSARSISYRHPNFRIELPPDQPIEILLRAQSQSSMQVPLELYTPAAFTSLSRDSQFVMGIYYGILLALFVYNLVLWLTLRDPSYCARAYRKPPGHIQVLQRRHRCTDQAASLHAIPDARLGHQEDRNIESVRPPTGGTGLQRLQRHPVRVERGCR